MISLDKLRSPFFVLFLFEKNTLRITAVKRHVFCLSKKNLWGNAKPMSQIRFMCFWVWELSEFFFDKNGEAATHCTLPPKYVIFLKFFDQKSTISWSGKLMSQSVLCVFSWCLWGWSWDFLFRWRLGFSFAFRVCFPRWCRASLLMPNIGRRFLHLGLASLFGVGLPSRGWGCPSFLDLGFPSGVGLPSWAGFRPGSGLPSCTLGVASLSNLGFVFLLSVRAALLVRGCGWAFRLGWDITFLLKAETPGKIAKTNFRQKRKNKKMKKKEAQNSCSLWQDWPVHIIDWFFSCLLFSKTKYSYENFFLKKKRKVEITPPKRT